MRCIHSNNITIFISSFIIFFLQTNNRTKLIASVSADFISFRKESLHSLNNENNAKDDYELQTEHMHPCDCIDDDDESVSDDPDVIDTDNNHFTKIAYLITLHNERTLIDASNLFRAIRSHHSLVMIHIDTKLPLSKYYNSSLYHEIHLCPCGSDVYVDSIYSAEWGKWSMNEPTLWAMEVLTHHRRFRSTDWEVFINLSADSLPVYTPQIMANLYARKGLKDVNFVTSSICETGLLPTPITWFSPKWHKRMAYTGNQHDNPLIHYVDVNGAQQSQHIPTFFGSQWMSLTRSFVEYITDELSRPDSLVSQYAEFLQKEQLMVTDETFFASLVMSVDPFNTTQIPKINTETVEHYGSFTQWSDMYAIRYERMDEHGPTASGFFPNEQRYEVPQSSIEHYGVEEPKVWGPYFLGVYDLANIKRSGALFIRKVSVFVEPNLYNLLPVEDIEMLPDIEWADIKISEFPDWNKIKAGLIEKAKARLKREKEQENETDLQQNKDYLEKGESKSDL